MEYSLDGRELNNRNVFHAMIKDLFEFPSYYGENLDALWDCMTTDVKLPATLIWVDYNYSEKLLGEYATLILQIFRQVVFYTHGQFKLILK